MMVRVKFVFLFMLFAICKWPHVLCEKRLGLNWSPYQKLQTIQIGLIHNENLSKYTNLSKYSIEDNERINFDRSKAKRFYNTEQCIKDLKAIQKASRDEIGNWASEMLGTWGKVPSVEFSKDYGNFDRCHDLETNKSINIVTQYCVASIDTKKKISPTVQEVGICIPNSCAPSLIATILNDYLNLSKSIRINIEANQCHYKNDNTTMFFSYKCYIAFLTMIIGLIVLCSIYDIICTVREERKNPVLLAFSAYSNGKVLFACQSNQSPNFMPCLDGIRAIAALWIVANHFAWLAPSSSINHQHYAPAVARLDQFFSVGHFSVDTFFVLSAILAANKMFHEFSKNDRLYILFLYSQRILRLSPVMIVIGLFNRYLLQFCANGPTYNNIDGMRYACENSLWDTLLFYSNYSSGPCVTGSWYLAADMHLYLLTPFMVLLLQRYPKQFICTSFVIILIDSIVALNNGRIGSMQLDSYFSTRARITPWLIGVIFAYILLKIRSKKHFCLPKYLNLILLTGSVSVILTLVYKYMFVDGSYGFTYKGRVWWSLSLCYIIFACLNGQGGIINWFLSWPSWQPISRLSFSIFLVHLPVIWVMFANRKVAWYLSVFTQIQELFSVVAISCTVAVVLALMVEMPIVNLKNIYLSKKKNTMILE